MNIALSAVLIFILLMPPVAFYLSYTSGRHTRGGLKFTILEALLASSIFSLFVHSLGLGILKDLNREVRFDILLKMVGGELKDLENKVGNDLIMESTRQFGLYSLVVFIGMLLLGQLFRFVAKLTELHSNVELLRIYNKWWYLFEGYTEINNTYYRRDFDDVVIDVIVDTDDGTMIYSGILDGYSCSGDELERILLSDAWRREFKKQTKDGDGKKWMENSPGPVKKIAGDTLMIPFKEIKNMNLKFFTYPEDLEVIEELPDVKPDRVEYGKRKNHSSAGETENR